MGNCSSLILVLMAIFFYKKICIMKIGSISEDLTLEKRVAITPEVAKKFIELGFELISKEIMLII